MALRIGKEGQCKEWMCVAVDFNEISGQYNTLNCKVTVTILGKIVVNITEIPSFGRQEEALVGWEPGSWERTADGRAGSAESYKGQIKGRNRSSAIEEGAPEAKASTIKNSYLFICHLIN